MISVNTIIQDAAQEAIQALVSSTEFNNRFALYPFAENVKQANAGAVNVYFYPTTVNEIKRQFAMLTQKTGSQFKFKFPCILLVLDNHIVYGGELPKAVVDISIVTQSNAEWPSYTRDLNVFEPVLRPIAQELLAKLSKSRHIHRPMLGFSYTYVERYNTSTDLMKEANQIYGASVDAVELIQLQLPLINLDC